MTAVVHEFHRTIVVGLLLVAGLATADTVILDPDPIGTVTGTAGLAGETFASGSVSSSARNTGYSASMPSSGVFAVMTTAGGQFSIRVYMNQFQNTTGAYVSQYVYSQPALISEETRSLDLQRAAGRISGAVAVLGGTVESMSLSAFSSNPAVPETFNGNVSTSAPPFVALLPMPVVPGTTSVSGSVTVRVSAGCLVARSLPSRSVTVISGAEVSIQWSLDLSTEPCNTGSVQGSLTTTGLGGANADVVASQRQVYVSGPEYRSVNLPAGQDTYLFENLRVGSYGVYASLCFGYPYSCLNLNGQPIQVTAGQVVQSDRTVSLGTAHGSLALNGNWDLSDLGWGYLYAYNNTAQGWSGYDYIDVNTGRFDLVLPAGDSQLQTRYFGNSRYDPATQSSTYWYAQESLSAAGATTITVGPAGRLQLDPLTIETSTADVFFAVAQQAGQPEARVNRLTANGNGYVRTATNAILANRYIYLDDTRPASSGLGVTLRGFPGTYQMQARGYGTDGRQYSAAFEVTMGEPNDTPAGTNVETPFEDADGNVLGKLTFANVTQGGDTTVSQVSIGPNPPPNFRVLHAGGQPQFYDINTTATFSGEVEVCLHYDDANLNKQDNEPHLVLEHYDDATATWTPITSDGSPDVVNNVICGSTTSFSIFAVLEPDVIDLDLDGVSDDLDNCPATANTNQHDFDADGVGDACDSDLDGDTLPDATDLCPNFRHSDNGDLDGDSVGDPCDGDVDGDATANASDNCPLIPNVEQTDFDLDGNGDECDTDDDADLVVDAADACPGSTMGAVIDADGCTSAQRFQAACPATAVYRNHGQYVSCVAHEAEEQVALRLLSTEDKGVVISTAAQTKVTTTAK